MFNITVPASHPSSEDEASLKNVLLIVTGGTMTMVNIDNSFKVVNGVVEDGIRKTSTLHDQEYFEKYVEATNCQEENRKHLFVLPKYASTDNRVIYSLYEFPQLLNSCNVDIEDYKQIADVIEQAYNDFDGFVVIHGTDTMAYTTSYLSFMLHNLGKSVIFTGSQIPINSARSDAVNNLQDALFLAGNYVLPEVTLLFNHTLYRGNRVTKVDSGNFNAYSSLNCDPLATLGVHVKINWDIIHKKPSKPFTVTKNLDPNVVVLRIFPGMTLENVQSFTAPPIKGIVVQTYGAGNGPSNRQDIMNTLKAASDRGVLIINCTQCFRGSVVKGYETGKALYDAGVIQGFDLTAEAALAKLSYVLAKQNMDNVQRKSMLLSNVCGEITVTENQAVFNGDLFLPALARSVKDFSSAENEILKLTLLSPLVCAAAKANKVTILKYLKELDADFSTVDYDNRTALHVAVSEGNVEAVKFLIENGESLSIKDRYGNTPLHDAVYFKRLDCVKLMVESGAELQLSKQEIGQALCVLAFENDLKGIKAWHAAGATLNEKNRDSRSLFDVATQLKSEKILQYLKETCNIGPITG